MTISAFSSLVGVPICISNSAVELKICALTAEIENYKSFTSQEYPI